MYTWHEHNVCRAATSLPHLRKFTYFASRKQNKLVCDACTRVCVSAVAFNKYLTSLGNCKSQVKNIDAPPDRIFPLSSFHKFSIPIRIDTWNAIDINIDGSNLFVDENVSIAWCSRVHPAPGPPANTSAYWQFRKQDKLWYLWALSLSVFRLLFVFVCVVVHSVLHRLAILFYFSPLNCLSIVRGPD